MDKVGLHEVAERIEADRDRIRRGLTDTIPAAGALEAERMRWIRHADRAELWRNEGARNCAEFLAALLQISKWKAHRLVATAHALEHLPHISAALAAGALSLDKTVELARFATSEDESELLRWAKRVGLVAIRKRADAAARKELAEVQDLQVARQFRYWLLDDRFDFEGSLPADQGAQLAAAVDDLAKKLPDDPDRDEDLDPDYVGPSSMDRRRADALVALVCRTDEGSAPAPTVILHAPAEVLKGDVGGVAVEGGPLLHPETARRFACDCRLQLVATDDGRKPIGIGRESQIAPRWLRRLVLHRDDHTCTFPGCEMKLFLHLHHIWHWVRGGPTDLGNLVTVCTFHHKLVHEWGWNVALRDDGAVWSRPDGRVYEPGPAPSKVRPSPTPVEPHALSWTVAAGHARLGLLIDLLAGRLQPSRKRGAASARLRGRRIPDWAREQLV